MFEGTTRAFISKSFNWRKVLTRLMVQQCQAQRLNDSRKLIFKIHCPLASATAIGQLISASDGSRSRAFYIINWCQLMMHFAILCQTIHSTVQHYAAPCHTMTHNAISTRYTALCFNMRWRCKLYVYAAFIYLCNKKVPTIGLI